MKWIQRPRNSYGNSDRNSASAANTGSAGHADEKSTKIENVYTVRIKYILLMLSKKPDWQENFVNTVSSILNRISSPFQHIGEGFNSPGFLQELIYRIQEKFLPHLPFSESIEDLFYEIFPDDNESIYVDFIEESVLAELISLFKDQTQTTEKLKNDILSASYILSVQILNNLFTIQKELKLLENDNESLSEFKLEGLLRSYKEQNNTSLTSDIFIYFKNIEKNLDDLYSMMLSHGVKIELVYLFQLQRRRIQRLEILLNFLSTERSTALCLRLYISQLIISAHHRKSFVAFISENLSLLTERIVQANSSIGEHYITQTWEEFKKMFLSALGGGAVTTFTVFTKKIIAKLSLEGFIKGFFEGLNYSSSFLVIYMMGFTLATKQPSNTAPFIANALQKSTTDARRSIVALLRTQFIAVIGNLTSVFPICFLISWLFTFTGNSLLTATEASETFHSTNFFGFSPFFAAFTGVLLFLSSIIAGWFENWIVINQVSQRIENSEKFVSFLGQKQSSRLARFISGNSNALAANIALGFLLGLTPQVIKFMGIPLEVRHVTLATGAFASSLPVLIQQASLNIWDYFNAISGIIFIGLINISVSFTLALLLASLSSKIKINSFYRLLKSGIHLILTKPWLLIIPEKDTQNKNI